MGRKGWIKGIGFGDFWAYPAAMSIKRRLDWGAP